MVVLVVWDVVWREGEGGFGEGLGERGNDRRTDALMVWAVGESGRRGWRLFGVLEREEGCGFGECGWLPN